MENQLTPITIARLKAAGFEPVDADKFTRVYKMSTLWQTLTIYHQYRGAESFTLAGIIHPSDRYTTAYVDNMIQAAALFGADVLSQEQLKKMLG